MFIEIPDKCIYMLENGEIKSLHIYLDKSCDISNIRVYLDSNKGFVTLFSKYKNINLF